MKNSSAILINHAKNCLHQMAQGADDPLSAVLSADDLLMFQQRCTVRVRNYPAVKTLPLCTAGDQCGQVLSQRSDC